MYTRPKRGVHASYAVAVKGKPLTARAMQCVSTRCPVPTTLLHRRPAVWLPLLGRQRLLGPKECRRPPPAHLLQTAALGVEVADAAAGAVLADILRP